MAAHYRVRVLPQAHELEVELRLSGLTKSLSLEVPTWVPGAYGFMKYGRDIFNVRARDLSTGEELKIERDGWQGYRIEQARPEIAIEYLAFFHDVDWGELTGILDHRQAVLLATRQLFAPIHKGPITVEYQLPTSWAMHHPSGARELSYSVNGETPTWSFEYPNFSVWLDTPVVIGAFDLRTRDSHGTPFHFVFLDRAVGFDWESELFIDAVMRLCEGCYQLFGSYPFERYSFILTFNPKSGWGLEHANATQISLDPEALFDAKHRFDAMRVCAHELFHAWNVCRLKPKPLGAPDHAQGSFPDALWVAEGFTRYYEFVLSARANECTPQTFFSNVVNYYRHLTAFPAYARVSAIDSSLSTFLNHNRYPGSVNNTVDYYDLGMLIAFDLDATLRLASSSLDVELSSFYVSHVSRADGYCSKDLRTFLEARHPHLGAMFVREVEEAGKLETEKLLERIGFQLKHETIRMLGLVLKEDKGPVVSDVLDNGPASAAGIAPGDELLRIDGHPFSLRALRWLVERQAKIELEVARGHQRFVFVVATGERKQLSKLTWQGTAHQQDRLALWLGKFDLAPGTEIPLTDYDNFHGVQTVL